MMRREEGENNKRLWHLLFHTLALINYEVPEPSRHADSTQDFALEFAQK